MKVQCDNCRMLYDRRTARDVLAKAFVDVGQIQEGCPGCGSNACTATADGEAGQ